MQDKADGEFSLRVLRLRIAITAAGRKDWEGYRKHVRTLEELTTGLPHGGNCGRIHY
jgi:hypothetical protein